MSSQQSKNINHGPSLFNVRLIPVKHQPMPRADYYRWRRRFYNIYVKRKWASWWERLPYIGYRLWCKKYEKRQRANRIVKEVMEV